MALCKPLREIRDFDECSPNASLPTIEEFGSGYVILGGNGVTLAERETYQFRDVASPLIRIRLIESGNSGARIQYETTRHYDTYMLRPDNNLQGTIVTRCPVSIDDDDATFQPRLNSLLLHPADFAPEWQVSDFTQFVRKEEFFPFDEPSDVVYTNIGVERSHTLDGQEAIVSYEINMGVMVFDSAEAARGALIEEDRQRGQSGLVANPQFQSQVGNFTEGCLPTLSHCIYSGQHGVYVLEVILDIPHDRSGVPVEDWQYIVVLAETKLLNGTLETP